MYSFVLRLSQASFEWNAIKSLFLFLFFARFMDEEFYIDVARGNSGVPRGNDSQVIRYCLSEIVGVIESGVKHSSGKWESVFTSLGQN